ncbi:MAG: hypothetical protein H7X89_06455 [Rhizobiales bacterium]|nr:hypothetical protein [Hyphomicrobiales bacterium]
MKPSTLSLVAALATLLAACNTGAQGVRFLNGSDTAKPQAEAIRNLTGDEIRNAIAGKTFQYTRTDGNGFITYGTDGSFEFQDDVKGSGKGTWSASSGQFCESFAGAPTDCGEFKTTGDAYFAAKSRLVEMKS